MQQNILDHEQLTHLQDETDKFEPARKTEIKEGKFFTYKNGKLIGTAKISKEQKLIICRRKFENEFKKNQFKRRYEIRMPETNEFFKEFVNMTLRITLNDAFAVVDKKLHGASNWQPYINYKFLYINNYETIESGLNDAIIL